jgi:hypothetical protein
MQRFLERKQVATEPDRSADRELFCCTRCLVELRPGAGDFYRVFIEAVADSTAPNLTAEDLASDIRQKIEQLIAQMSGLSEQEALDQVYRRLIFHLCGPCFREWIENPAG